MSVVAVGIEGPESILFPPQVDILTLGNSGDHLLVTHALSVECITIRKEAMVAIVKCLSKHNGGMGKHLLQAAVVNRDVERTPSAFSLIT